MSSGTSSRLGAAAKLFGGAELAEYESLLADSRQLQALKDALKKSGIGALVNPVASSLPTVGTVPTPDMQSKKKQWGKMTQQEQIYWIIEAAEEKSRNRKAWVKSGWRTYLELSFGKYDLELAGTLRSCVARAAGKFRPSFIARVRAAFEPGTAEVLVGRVMKL